MTEAVYQLQSSAGRVQVRGLIRHFPDQPSFVRDMDDTYADRDKVGEEMHLQARIRSGDYILTLATEIDRIAQSLAGVKAPEAPDLERIVTELMAINRDYSLEKK